MNDNKLCDKKGENEDENQFYRKLSELEGMPIVDLFEHGQTIQIRIDGVIYCVPSNVLATLIKRTLKGSEQVMGVRQ